MSSLFGLSSRDLWLLVRIEAMLALSALAMRLIGAVRWKALLSRNAAQRESKVPAAGSLERAREVGRLVRIAATRGLFTFGCLPRAMTCWWVLRREGIEAQVMLGARRGDGPFEAHAWVEFGGVALNEADDVRERFAVFEAPANIHGSRH